MTVVEALALVGAFVVGLVIGRFRRELRSEERCPEIRRVANHESWDHGGKIKRCIHSRFHAGPHEWRSFPERGYWKNTLDMTEQIDAEVHAALEQER